MDVFRWDTSQKSVWPRGIIDRAIMACIHTPCDTESTEEGERICHVEKEEQVGSSFFVLTQPMTSALQPCRGLSTGDIDKDNAATNSAQSHRAVSSGANKQRPLSPTPTPPFSHTTLPPPPPPRFCVAPPQSLSCALSFIIYVPSRLHRPA
jgi:hypothetical protein